jgi:type IV fimbrial biogenesis protein FimT
MGCKMHDQKGFSLLELFVVIAIIAVAAGVLLPVFNSMRPKFRLGGAARQLQGDLLWARMQAINKNNEFKVFFLNKTCNIAEHAGSGSTDHIYQILDDEDGDGSIDSGETVIEKHIQTDYLDVVVGSATASPVFQPRGNASGATIVLQNPSGTKQLVISPASGRIKIN